MLILLTVLSLLLIGLCIGYWSTHIYPELRPYRYNKSPDVHISEAKHTMEHKTLAARYHLQELVAGHLTDAEQIANICSWAYSLWEPKSGRSTKSNNPLTIVSLALYGERFSRADYVTVIAHAMMAIGIPTRVVTLNTRDCSWRPLASSYSGIEYFDREHFKWVWLDAQHGIRIIHEFEPLNVLEIKEAILNQNLLELRPDRPELDIENYLLKLRPFLDIVIAQPIGHKKRFALIPPQIRILKKKWGFGKAMYDITCHSPISFYASHPIKQLTTPNKPQISRIPVARKVSASRF